jgi:hypothetical protein
MLALIPSKLFIFIIGPFMNQKHVSHWLKMLSLRCLKVSAKPIKTRPNIYVFYWQLDIVSGPIH